MMIKRMLRRRTTIKVKLSKTDTNIEFIERKQTTERFIFSYTDN